MHFITLSDRKINLTSGISNKMCQQVNKCNAGSQSYDAMMFKHNL